MHRPAQHSNVAGAFGVGVGVRKEAPLGWHTGAAQLGHQRFVGQRGNVALELIFLGQRLAHLAPVPALDQGDGAQALFAAHQLLQQAAGGGARGDFIVASLDGSVLARDAEPGVEHAGIHTRPCGHHVAGDAPGCGAGLDGKLQRLAAGHQRLVQPPESRTTRCDQNQHDQSQ
ncbi:hypothetical protein D3C71_1289200 [compost metagenome]